MKILNFTPSKNLFAELSSIEKCREALLQSLDQTQSLEDVCAPLLSSVSGLEFLERTQSDKKMKILDVGFGEGATSLYLASKSHEVHSLDPSFLLCELLEKKSQKLHLSLSVYQGVAEEIEQIPEEEFDLCIFHASLHHCEDPIRALAACRKKLKIKGRALLINEPLLKFYHSKKWFFKKLKSDPISLGHYGGNEHIYSFHEYLNFLKQAGFSRICHFLHIQYQHPRLTIWGDMTRKVHHQYVHSDGKLILKFFILFCLQKIISIKYLRRFIVMLLKKLSLVPVSFEGIKD
jgi:ubiquinone/menaquinone biosynthesis C-methylase UbiE